MANMKLTRRLTEGVGAWLHFEFACNRSGLFNESYLSVPVGQILSATFGDRILSEFKHPVLAPLMVGSGRRPAIDFVYCDPYPTIKIAVEAKWAGSSNTTVENIIWDLIRLEQVAYHYEATSIFLLAGRRDDLVKLITSVDFVGRKGSFETQPILRTDLNTRLRLSLLPDSPYRIPLFRRLFRQLQNVPIPHRLYTVRTEPFPTNSPTSYFQVFAWTVQSSTNRKEFLPSNISHYRV